MVSTSWVGTKENVVADAITRENRWHDISLTPRAFRELSRWMGRPNIDWCASNANVQRDAGTGEPLPFVSRYPCPGAVAVDVLSCNVRYIPGGDTLALGYAFPPEPLVAPFVAWLKQCRGKCILVTTGSNNQLWWPTVSFHTQKMLCLGKVGAVDVLRVPQKDGAICDLPLKESVVAHLLDFSRMGTAGCCGTTGSACV